MKTSPFKTELATTLQELQEAFIEDAEATLLEDSAKARKSKARIRLILAKEAVRNLEADYKSL